MVKVILDGWLREFGAPSETDIDAEDVRGLFDVLESHYPRLRFRLRDETGSLRRFVRVFVDQAVIDPAAVMSVSLRKAKTVDILHSIAGG